MNRVNLDVAPINLADFVSYLPRTCAFKGTSLIQVQDFGTVLIGELSDEEAAISIPQKGTFLFTAPPDWRMPQLLKSLSVFKSTTEARKNGWDKDIPSGCSSILVRIRKVLGEVWIHKA